MSTPAAASKGSAPLRFGVIGVGARGGAYARALASGEVEGAVLGAVCDVRPSVLEPFASAARFDDANAMLSGAALDVLVVATPHPAHVEPTRAGLAAGLHVLTEKPIAIEPRDARRLLAEYERRERRSQLFATALVLRADRRYVKLHESLRQGTLGRVQRIAWTVTDCFRTQAYYESADWRGTFRGEGGGLLVNQCSHQLDLWQWLFGMPDRVHAFLGLGRFHAIEVEDQVTAYFDYASGATGVFVASTGEAPGTNRLEVAFELGRVVIEGERFETWLNPLPTPEQIRTGAVRARALAAQVESERLAVGGVGPRELLRNVVRAASGSEPLLAPASEGLASIELASALLASGLGARAVDLAADGGRHPSLSTAARPS
jgi:predicted dehydrogenase